MAAEAIKTIKSKKTGKVLAVLYDDDTMRIDGVRLSYPHLDKPWAKDELVKLNEKLAKAANFDYADVRDDAKFLVNGDAGGSKPESKGCYIVRTREERKPFTKGLKNENLTEQQVKDQLFAGCVTSVLIRPWAQKSADWGKRLNCGIVGVRKLGEGE